MMKKGFKDLAYMVSSNTVLKLLGIVSIVIFTRYLEKEELALIPVFALLGRLSVVVFSFGMLPKLIKDVPSLLKKKAKTHIL